MNRGSYEHFKQCDLTLYNGYKSNVRTDQTLKVVVLKIKVK